MPGPWPALAAEELPPDSAACIAGPADNEAGRPPPAFYNSIIYKNLLINHFITHGLRKTSSSSSISLPHPSHLLPLHGSIATEEFITLPLGGGTLLKDINNEMSRNINKTDI
jgi:hypothetical protein